MEGQFQVGRGSCTTTEESRDATPAIEPNRPAQAWQFVDEFQRLVGDDSEPDIRFFVESWTSGTAAAVENFQQRRQREPARERPRDAFRKSDSLEILSCEQELAFNAEFTSSIPAPTVAGAFKAGWRPQSDDDPVARMQEQAWRQWERFTEEHGASSGAVHPITLESARLLLGVTPASTRKQIKAAYRRMVSQWHPDRLELGTEDVRQIATERMAAINEAYHLLLSNLR
jgi:DnaJ-domain-containing protein 1